MEKKMENGFWGLERMDSFSETILIGYIGTNLGTSTGIHSFIPG